MKTGTIRQRRVFPAKPIEVYNAFIDSNIHSAFTGAKAICTSKVGARFTAWDGYISGKNLELVKVKKIVQEWSTSEWPENYPPSILTLIFKAKGEGTELTMIHSKVPAEQLAMYRDGWVSSYWKPLLNFFKQV